MALSDEVQSRYGAQLLKELSNPKSPASSSLDSTRLTLAATDAAARFEIATGVAYDGTNAKHVAIAVEGVVWILLGWSGNRGPMAKAAEDSWKRGLEDLAQVTGRDRITPVGTSTLTPSGDPSGTNVRPLFDRERFGGIQLRGPRPQGQRDTDDSESEG